MRKVASILLLVSMAFMLSSCKMTTDDFFAMDTYMSISINGTKKDADKIKKEIYRLDSLFSSENIDKSNIEVYSLAQKSHAISELTDGAFDITVAPLMDIWGFRDEKYRVPSNEETKDALLKVGYTRPYEEQELDFGAVAKGYAGDKIKEILQKSNIKSAIVSLGGNVLAHGMSFEGRPWKVGIQNPKGEGYIGYVNVHDTNVVTSGGYRRYFESEGKKYSHIIDPKNGYPADSGVLSVTVISPDGALADALSTAFFVMGKDKTEEFCINSDYKTEFSEFAVILVDESEKVYCFGDIEFLEE